ERSSLSGVLEYAEKTIAGRFRYGCVGMKSHSACRIALIILVGLRFLRRFRLAGTVEGDRLANERLEGGLVDFVSFVDVDRAACVSVETRVEETGRILQRRALGEGKLHDILVGFASADDAVVRPNRSAHHIHLLDDGRVRLLAE